MDESASTPGAIRDLYLTLSLLETGGDKINAELEQISPPIVSLDKFGAQVESILGDRDRAAALVRVVVFLSQVSRSEIGNRAASLEETLNRFFEIWKTEPSADLATESSLAQLDILLSSPHVVATSKAMALGFSSEKLYHDSKILCDLRPLFDDDKTEVLGFVTTQEIQIDFVESGVDRRLAIALDKGDIVRMKEMCEDALRKVQELETSIPKRCSLSVVAAGE